MFKAIADFDRRYAGKVLENLGGAGKAPIREYLTASPLFDKPGYTPDNDIMSAIAERVVVGGVLGLNAGYRYGLPAAGVTLAGKALFDLTGAYETQTSGTIMP